MFEKTKTRFKIAAGVVLAVIILVVLLKSGTYDPTWIFICAAVAAVAFLGYTVLKHVFLPKRTFSIETDISLKAPMIPELGRYSFAATVVARELTKGDSSVVSQKRIEVKLRKKDHPHIVEDCLRMIDAAIAEQKQTIHALDPKARILLSDSYIKAVKPLLPSGTATSQEEVAIPEKDICEPAGGG